MWCYKEQYCIGIWNVRSTNQGKLEAVKQEMARVNIDILGISELKWARKGEFNSDDCYIYYCGQESLRRNGVVLITNKSLKCSTWMQSQKWQNDLWSFPRQTMQYHSNPNLCSYQYCWRSWHWMILWRPTKPSRSNTQRRCPFHYRGLECKNKKLRNTWSNRQIGLGIQNEAGQRLTVLPRECTGHSKHPLQTTQETILRVDIPDGQQQNQIDYILYSQRWRSSI